MSQSFITRQQMLEIMQSGRIFSITWCTLDFKKKKGGEQMDFPEAVLMKKQEKGEPITQHKNTAAPSEVIQQVRKNPNHKKHFTRNIRMMINGEPTGTVATIHIRLVEKFNGMTVIV